MSDHVGNFFLKKRIPRVWYRFCFIFSTHHCASFFLSRQRCKNDSEKEWNESADLHWFLGIELREESSAPKNQIANHSLLGFFLCACVCGTQKISLKGSIFADFARHCMFFIRAVEKFLIGPNDCFEIFKSRNHKSGGSKKSVPTLHKCLISRSNVLIFVVFICTYNNEKKKSEK